MPKRRASVAPQEPAVVNRPVRPAGDPSDVSASHGPCPVSNIFVTNNSNGKVYLSKDCFPSYIQDDIWAILQDCGFKYVNGFRHKGIPNFLDVSHEDDVRRKLAEIGLPPNVADQVTDEDDLPTLQRWVAFANVPLKESDAAKVLENLPLPSDHQALVWLEKLGYKVDGKTKQIYRVRNDGGIEEYDSINQIRSFVRQADNESLIASGGGGGPGGGDSITPSRKRSRRATRKKDVILNDDDMLALRLWGAVAPAPLRVVGEELRIEDYNKSLPNSSTSMEIDTINNEKDEAQTKLTSTKELTNGKLTQQKAIKEVPKELVKDAKKASAQEVKDLTTKGEPKIQKLAKEAVKVDDKVVNPSVAKPSLQASRPLPKRGQEESTKEATTQKKQASQVPATKAIKGSEKAAKPSVGACSPVATGMKGTVASKTTTSAAKKGSGSKKVKAKDVVLSSSSSKPKKEDDKHEKNNGSKILKAEVAASPSRTQDKHNKTQASKHTKNSNTSNREVAATAAVDASSARKTEVKPKADADMIVDKPIVKSQGSKVRKEEAVAAMPPPTPDKQKKTESRKDEKPSGVSQSRVPATEKLGGVAGHTSSNEPLVDMVVDHPTRTYPQPADKEEKSATAGNATMEGDREKMDITLDKTSMHAKESATKSQKDASTAIKTSPAEPVVKPEVDTDDDMAVDEPTKTNTPGTASDDAENTETAHKSTTTVGHTEKVDTTLDETAVDAKEPEMRRQNGATSTLDTPSAKTGIQPAEDADKHMVENEAPRTDVHSTASEKMEETETVKNSKNIVENTETMDMELDEPSMDTEVPDTIVDEPTPSEDRSEEEEPAPVAGAKATQPSFQAKVPASTQNDVDFSSDQNTKGRPQMETAQASPQQGSESSCVIL